MGKETRFTPKNSQTQSCFLRSSCILFHKTWRSCFNGIPVQTVELKNTLQHDFRMNLFSEGLPSCVARRPLFHEVNLPRCEARRRLFITGLNSMIYIIYILYYLVFTLYFLVFALCLIKLHCSQPILRFKNFFSCLLL